MDAFVVYPGAVPSSTIERAAPVSRPARLPAFHGTGSLGVHLSASSLLAAAAVSGVATVAGKRSERVLRRAKAEVVPSKQQASVSVGIGRADFVRGLGGAAVASGLAPSAPASALSVDEAKQVLTQYGTPSILPKSIPNNWQVAVEAVGLTESAGYSKAQLGSEPIVVSFTCPGNWVITKPNIDFNGTAGTVQANDYTKGDSAILYVQQRYSKKLEDMKMDDYSTILYKALTQKAKSFVDTVAINKVTELEPGYKQVEFEWSLNSGAGFFIARLGYATLCQVGENNNLQVLWAGTTSTRWDAVKNDLKNLTGSFKVEKVPESYKEDVIKVNTSNLEGNDTGGYVLG